MNEALTYSQDCIDLIKTSESLRLVAYPDPASGGEPYTIGYGHTGPDIYLGKKITEDEAEVYLLQDIQRCETAIYGLVRVTLTQGQFDALVDFIFNEGVSHFKDSTLLRLINRGLFDLADKEFAKWDLADGKKFEGLTKRRAAEAALFDV
jgi:lysozyme